jgi:glycosyltransferase involved in cell wall biosynthesis
MFNQGPEAEAVIHGETGLYFKEDDIDSLSDAIDDLILNRKKLFMEVNCIRQIKKYWNPMKQSAVFDEAVLKSISALSEKSKD